jgi:hypothetical protein
VKADIEAATDLEVSYFTVGDQAVGEGHRLELALPDGQETFSTADLAATILVLDEHRAKNPSMRRSPGWSVVAGEDSMSVGWTADPESSVYDVGRTHSPHDDSYCRLPDLIWLEPAGPRSDLSRIGRCSPALSTLAIEDWGSSTGREGLADLGDLKELLIFGPVDDVSDIPALDSLEYLKLHLAEDTTANRDALQARLPDCTIHYTDANGQIAMYPVDSNPAKELVERSIPRPSG